MSGITKVSSRVEKMMIGHKINVPHVRYVDLARGGHPVRWEGPGWYGLVRATGTEFYEWVRFSSEAAAVAAAPFGWCEEYGVSSGDVLHGWGCPDWKRLSEADAVF